MWPSARSFFASLKRTVAAALSAGVESARAGDARESGSARIKAGSRSRFRFAIAAPYIGRGAVRTSKFGRGGEAAIVAAGSRDPSPPDATKCFGPGPHEEGRAA